MNYLELINSFWQCNNERPVGCNAIALYFYLLKTCNSLGWKESFKHSDRYISLQLGISVNTVRTTKNKLKQLGLIDFKSPEKASRGLDGATTYRILTVSYVNRVPDRDYDTAGGRVPDKDCPGVADTRNKQNKTKQNTIPSIPGRKEEEKTERFSPPSLEEVMNYCNERGGIISAWEFINFYESKGWMVGRNKMKDWKAAVRTWEAKTNKPENNGKNQNNTSGHDTPPVYGAW